MFLFLACLSVDLRLLYFFCRSICLCSSINRRAHNPLYIRSIVVVFSFCYYYAFYRRSLSILSFQNGKMKKANKWNVCYLYAMHLKWWPLHVNYLNGTYCWWRCYCYRFVKRYFILNFWRENKLVRAAFYVHLGG